MDNKYIKFVIIAIIIIMIIMGINVNKKNEKNESETNVVKNILIENPNGDEKYVIYDEDTGAKITEVDGSGSTDIFEQDPSFNPDPTKDFEAKRENLNDSENSEKIN